MNDDNGTNRLAELQAVRPNRLQLGQTGCAATLDDAGIIHVTNSEEQQIYALKVEHIPFVEQPLLVTLNLWFMAYNSGRSSMQQEFKQKLGEVLKLCL